MGRARANRCNVMDGYRFEGFRPQLGKVRGVFGGPAARILPLQRRSKKPYAAGVVLYTARGMTASSNWYGTCPAGTWISTWRLNTGVLIAAVAAK